MFISSLELVLLVLPSLEKSSAFHFQTHRL